jgi:hypothetical protein
MSTVRVTGHNGTAVHVDAEVAAAVGPDDAGVGPGVGVADHDERALQQRRSSCGSIEGPPAGFEPMEGHPGLREQRPAEGEAG